MHSVVAVFVFASSVAAVQAVAAQQADPAYPHKPIRMILPLPPGGSVDPTARMVAGRLGPRLKQQVVVDNRAGGSGTIAAETVARAAPDGYTLFFATPTVVVNAPLMNKKLPYNPARDFAPVSLVVSNPFLLTVPASLQVNTVQELITLAKRKPGALNYGTSGEGAPQHIAIELLKSMAGIDIVHVPYKGGGAIQQDLVTGRIQLYASAIIGVASNVKSGKLKALAVTTTKRAGAMPEVPTVAESGVPGYDYQTWYAIFTTAGTPVPIVNRLNTEIAAVLADPELVKNMAEQGSDLRGSTPAALAALVKSETQRLGPLFEKIGLADK